MDIIDNLKKGVTKTVDEAEKFTKVVMNKTTNMVEVTKLNLALNDTKSKINKIYSNIGEFVYKKYLDGTEFDGEIGSCCEEIDNFQKEIDSLKEQLADLKNATACTNCGEYNDKSNEYCTKCGSKLSDNVDESYSGDQVDVVDVSKEQFDK